MHEEGVEFLLFLFIIFSAINFILCAY